MSRYEAVADFDAVLASKILLPTITVWNRLEGRPRTDNFDRALRAEIRDPLWMLAKQWQMGEFRGDDAGSPINAKIHYETTQLTRYCPSDDAVERFDSEVPLEAKVERRAIPFEADGQPLSLDIRLLMGKRWLKMVAPIEAGLGDQYIALYGVAPVDPGHRADAAICARTELWQQFSALAGRAMDGWRLYRFLKADVAHHSHVDLVLGDPASVAAIETAEAQFVAWFEATFFQPVDGIDDAWRPDRLEYAFNVQAPRGASELTLMADEYHHGHLDWYNFDIDPSGIALDAPADEPVPLDVEASETLSFIPVPISFDGMPNTRWWTFEEGRTNFGDIDPDTVDINKLLLMEFGLVYANDWFLLPMTVPAGTIVSIKGMAVTNVFGERTWVEASGQGSDEDWQRWCMFGINTRGKEQVAADLSLLVLPTVSKIQESDAFESVHLVRDEVANMVWGIETVIPLASGESCSGRSAAFEVARLHRQLTAAVPAPAGLPENEATTRYQVMTSVPENWIPFIPVHIENDTREVQLRRAAMPRIIEGDPDPPLRIRPRTTLLRHGLDFAVPQPLTIHEEEVPRAGARVSQAFQRARWYDGQVFTWFGARKRTGHGEQSSKLKFDQSIAKKPR